MQQYAYLSASSVLYWLITLIGVAIIFIGARFIIAPIPAARDFGVPAADTEQSTYLWTKGTRDIGAAPLLLHG